MPFADAAATTPRFVPVEDSSQVPLARSLAGEMARAAGFATNRVHEIELAATELAENLHRYSDSGKLMVLPPGFGDDGTLTLLALDRGPGVAAFHLCLADGYSTGGTMGTGLGAVRRLASRFDAVSEPGRGTVVAATFAARGAGSSVPSFDIGAVGMPVPPEVVNGDGFVAVQRGSRLVAMVADGLGHGEGAAVAARAVTEIVSDDADSHLGPAELLVEAGRRAAHTRGAAATVIELTSDVARDGGMITASGMGNVSLLMVAPDANVKRAATSHGTVGAHVATIPDQRQEPLVAGGVVVLHTDGLTSRWSLDNRVELLRHSSVVIAAVLWRDFTRGTDDSLVLVVRDQPSDGSPA